MIVVVVFAGLIVNFINLDQAQPSHFGPNFPFREISAQEKDFTSATLQFRARMRAVSFTIVQLTQTGQLNSACNASPKRKEPHHVY